jgi:hypothetical protein
MLIVFARLLSEVAIRVANEQQKYPCIKMHVAKIEQKIRTAKRFGEKV